MRTRTMPRKSRPPIQSARMNATTMNRPTQLRTLGKAACFLSVLRVALSDVDFRNDEKSENIPTHELSFTTTASTVFEWASSFISLPRVCATDAPAGYSWMSPRRPLRRAGLPPAPNQRRVNARMKMTISSTWAANPRRPP